MKEQYTAERTEATGKGASEWGDNPFRYAWSKGYERLLPVFPPDAEISETSNLSAAARGKSPGTRLSDGTWVGRNMHTTEAREEDLDEWNDWGAGVGLRGDNTLFFVDIDHMDPAKSARLQALAEKHLGKSFPRIGQWPKVALPYRSSAPIASRNAKFDDNPVDGKWPGIDLISDKPHLVIYGVHPKTGKPYTWPNGFPDREQLPVVDPEAVEEFFNAVFEEFPPKSNRQQKSYDGPAPDPEELMAPSLEELRKTVARIPNSHALYPDRDDFIDMAYAIKGAAGPENEEFALEQFREWCERYDGENDPDYVDSNFARAKPPIRIGYKRLLRHAAISLLEPVDPDRLAQEQQAENERNEMFAPPTATDNDDRNKPLVAGEITLDDLNDIPPRQWLYGYKVSRKYTTFIASPGGTGKTAFCTAMALACVSGEALLRDMPVKPLKVWILNLEDDMLEIKRRISAALKHYDLDPRVLGSLRVNSGRDRGFSIVRENRDGGYVVEPDFDAIVSEMKRNKIDLLIVDPFLRSHRVKENDNEAQDEVMRLYAQIAERTDAGVVLVHHVKKGGVAGDMDSLRGGSAQGAGARSVLTMSQMSAEEAKKLGIDEKQRRLYVRVDDAKNNMAPPAQRAEWIKLASENLGNGDEVYEQGDSVQVATPFELPEAWDGLSDEAEAEALKLIEKGTESGERYSIRVQEKERWAGHLLMTSFGRTKAQASEILKGWMAANIIEVREYLSPKQRKDRKGIFVNSMALVERKLSEDGVFG